MKKVIFILCLLFIGGKSFGQTSVYFIRDSASRTPSFVAKIRVAAFTKAKTITDTATAANVTNLKKYAQLVVSEPFGPWLYSLSLGVAINATISFTSTDTEIQNVLNTIFASWADAYYRK